VCSSRGTLRVGNSSQQQQARERVHHFHVDASSRGWNLRRFYGTLDSWKIGTLLPTPVDW